MAVSDRTKNVGRHVVLLVWAFVCLAPLCWIGFMSLKPPGHALDLPPKWVFLPTVYNYMQLANDPSFVHALTNSLISVTASVIIVLVVGVPGAYVLSRYDVPKKPDVLIWILSSRMLPPIAVVIPFFVIFRTFHLYDTLVGLVFMYVTINIALVVWVMKAFFDGIPQSLEEAALVDGATRSQAFRKVVLPSALPGIISVAIISFIFAWIELLFSLILTNNHAQTLSLAVYGFIGSRNIEWSMLAAASMTMIIPVLVLLVAANRYLASGLSFGAVLKE
ncbi:MULTISPECIES: carbohydrate ABC transporter permease [unclassified Haladaptatus]|uniref:carbohydrate ABC transporter permease n=1 Tax=unclassified Haladaptatus TaxID=2622732 RepID=UPI00209C2DCD|nr:MULTISPECIES: carbohydrate ABC transporter permease [unclassified Haladaptatus]MCO8243711.1 carbohydrate ABC transporter permease [Haladaptatus sp. AB643]MCO8255120.1 carbohydrate ABC transporter permease [Haladaptatus sp. AB618]